MIQIIVSPVTLTYSLSTFNSILLSTHSQQSTSLLEFLLSVQLVQNAL